MKGSAGKVQIQMVVACSTRKKQNFTVDVTTSARFCSMPEDGQGPRLKASTIHSDHYNCRWIWDSTEIRALQDKICISRAMS